ncbi:hypothetical protein ACFO1V_03360 [Daeguia caeni]|uniref:Uncharacterized protein n=1 Tax=Daeguia caeni TaxID=439612 RepID=A0ABV9H557_9HYPH
MALSKLWTGKVAGTSTGNVFLQLSGEDTALLGTLRFNEAGVGIVVYSIAGTFDGTKLTVTGEPQNQIEGFAFGRLTAVADLNQRGEFWGQWETDIGSAGTFVLFPSDLSQANDANASQPLNQLHTARHDFTAIEIARDQIIEIAEEIQNEFKTGPLVVTVEARTTQTCFLPDFKKLHFSDDQAKIIKLFVQEPAGGLSRAVTIEFGPQMNFALTQGPDKAWVLGTLEQIKSYVQPYERSYSTNLKRFGIGFNQAILFGALVFLPSLNTIRDRALLLGVVVALALLVAQAHQRYLPFASIHLRAKRVTLWSKIAPSLVSWLLTASAAIVSGLLLAYLQGWMGRP